MTDLDRRGRALYLIAYLIAVEQAVADAVRAFRPRYVLGAGQTFAPPHDCDDPVCRTCGRETPEPTREL